MSEKPVFRFVNSVNSLGKPTRQLVVDFPDWYNVAFVKSNEKVLRALFQYANLNFQIKQLTHVEKIFEDIISEGFESICDEVLTLRYGDGKTAMLRAVLYGTSRYDIMPAWTVIGSLASFTVMPGQYSDFTVLEYNDKLHVHSQNVLPYMQSISAVFLIEYVALVENYKNGHLPNGFDVNGVYKPIMNNEYCMLIKEIRKEIDSRMSVNERRRIDCLIVDGKSVDDWRDALNITNLYTLSSSHVLKICMAIGKPPRQVMLHLKKLVS